MLGWEDWRGYAFALTVSMSFLGWGFWRSSNHPTMRAYRAEATRWSDEQRAAGRSSWAVEWHLTRDALVPTYTSIRVRIAAAVIIVLAIYTLAAWVGASVRQVAS
jgi:hypothetical protein